MGRRQTERERQTDRETDRQTDRQTDRPSSVARLARRERCGTRHPQPAPDR